MNVDWSDPTSQISKHFTVKEACLLPSWGVMHVPTEEEQAEILKTAAMMDQVRDFLGKPVKVHCWIRPGSVNCGDSRYDGKDYNAFVKGASNSAHKYGKAVDWDCGENCDDTRTALMPKLEELGVRMENVPGGPWVHLDTNTPNPNRFFKP